MEAAGYGQANMVMVDDIVTRLTAEFTHQANLAFRPPPSEPPAPPLVLPASAAHATTDTILQQVLAQNQELMKMLASKANNSSSNNNRRPRTNASASKRTGQPSYPIPAWAKEYCWTYGKCSHKSSNCRNQLRAIKRTQHWKPRRMEAHSDAPDGVGSYKVMKIILIAIFY